MTDITDDIKYKPADEVIPRKRPSKHAKPTKGPRLARAGVIAGTSDDLRPSKSKADAFVAKAKAKASWDWRDRSGENLYEVPQETMDWANAHKLDLQWVVESVYGQPQDMSPYQKNGWTAITDDDQISGVENPHRGGQLLHARPIQLTHKARRHDDEVARSRIREHEQRVTGGDIGVSGSRHESALRTNKINRHRERIEIPGDA